MALYQDLVPDPPDLPVIFPYYTIQPPPVPPNLYLNENETHVKMFERTEPRFLLFKFVSYLTLKNN
jgi:hypothetical protein